MRQDRAKLKDELSKIYADIDEVRLGLWPDNYAGGATVERLAANVQHLCRIIQEELA